MQFSTDDEEFEEVVADFDTTAAVLGQGEGLARSAQPINYLPGNGIVKKNWPKNLFQVLSLNISLIHQVDTAKTKVNKLLKLWYN